MHDNSRLPVRELLRSFSMDRVDRQILNLSNKGLPLSERPYRELAKALGISEKEIIMRIKVLKEKGIIRRIGAVIDPRSIGWQSTLCAADVLPEHIEQFADIVGRYDEVTHNYLREGHPNCWFTLIAPNVQRLGDIISEMEQQLSIKILSLPARKIFKIRVSFEFS
jgi:DNA-binding Lrp family transcriptional regulator